MNGVYRQLRVEHCCNLYVPNVLWLQEGKMYGICNTRYAFDELVLNLN